MKNSPITFIILLPLLWLSGCVTMELSEEDDDESLDRHEHFIDREHLEEQQQEMLHQENEQLELIDDEEPPEIINEFD